MFWLWTERFVWAIGIAASAGWALASGVSLIAADQELRRFVDVQATAVDTPVDATEAPLAVLRIPKIKLEVAVLEGTTEWVLHRAVGHIEDTALPGTDGNSGIAGHRDRFFRGLRNVRVGDLLEIETRGQIAIYRVERTWIVDPADVSVLEPTASPSITLVTCYPFYFVGSAPQRFIVRAVRTERVRHGS